MTTRLQVARSFASSLEAEIRFIQDAYQRFLGRAASPDEVSGWIPSAGLTQRREEVLAQIAASKECWQHATGDQRTWLGLMYRQMLGREAVPAELDRWQAALNGTPAVDASLPANPPASLGQLQAQEEKRNENALAAGNPCNLVLLGDSITDQLSTIGLSVWLAKYAPFGTLNLAISGLSSAEVRWQVERGQVVQAWPKVVQIMVGTNDLGLYQRSPAQIVQTVAYTIQTLTNQLPQVKVLLVGVLPRFDGAVLPQTIAQLNAGYAQLADGVNVRFIDPGQAFVNGTASLYQLDKLHPSALGQGVLANLTLPILSILMGSAK